MKFGVDGCSGGWCCCSSYNNSLVFYILKDVKFIFQEFPKINYLFIDIPIGLSDYGFKRLVDAKLRDILPPNRKSSVFNAPSRPSIYSDSYNDAKQAELRLHGKSISIQSWNISKKIKELDQYFHENPQVTYKLRESHPEFCFYKLNNNIPLQFSKKMSIGIEERLSILKNFVSDVEDSFNKFYNKNKYTGLKKDDVIDSIALYVCADKWEKNGGRSISQLPPKDLRGIPCKIYY